MRSASAGNQGVARVVQDPEAVAERQGRLAGIALDPFPKTRQGGLLRAVGHAAVDTLPDGRLVELRVAGLQDRSDAGAVVGLEQLQERAEHLPEPASPWVSLRSPRKSGA